MRASWTPLIPGFAVRMVIAVAVTVATASCQPTQEEAQKRVPHATQPSTQAGMIELPDGSPMLAQIQTERVEQHPMRMSLKAQGGKILPNENRLAHLGPRGPGRAGLTDSVAA